MLSTIEYTDEQKYPGGLTQKINICTYFVLENSEHEILWIFHS